jgi:hypothetical protein
MTARFVHPHRFRYRPARQELPGESDTDATDAESSVLAHDPTFTSCLVSH